MSPSALVVVFALCIWPSLVRAQLVRLAPDDAIRAGYATVRPLRRATHLHGFSNGTSSIAIFRDVYDGPLVPVERCDDHGATDIPVACETVDEIPEAERAAAIGVLAIDAGQPPTLLVLLLASRHRPNAVGYDWWLADLDGDGHDEVWLDAWAEGGRDAAALWIVGPSRGHTRLRFHERRNVHGTGVHQPTAVTRLLDVRPSGPDTITVRWRRHAPVHCRVTDESGWEACDDDERDASLDLLPDADGHYDVPEGFDPFAAVPLPPRTSLR